TQQQCAPAASGRLAPARSARPLPARQRPRPDAEICDEKGSWASLREPVGDTANAAHTGTIGGNGGYVGNRNFGCHHSHFSMGGVMQWADRIGHRLKLRDLHILITVAQHGSMGKAAKQLSVSQPVVSKAITDMEHMLKVRLLDRTPHGVEPTLYGRA